MNSLFNYCVLIFLLAAKALTISADVVNDEDESVKITYKNALLEKDLKNTVFITNGSSANFLKTSDKLDLSVSKSFFESDYTDGKVIIGDGNSPYLKKYSDGWMEVISGPSQIIKYDENVEIYHGDSIQLQKPSNGVTIKDVNLGLEKDAHSTKLHDGKSAFVIKSQGGYVSIIKGSSYMEKRLDGNVEIYDGISASIKKNSDGYATIYNSKSSIIEKNLNGYVHIMDGSSILKANEENGYVEICINNLSVMVDDSGTQTISDGSASIVKDTSSVSNFKDGKTTILKDRQGIKVTLSVKPKESKDLTVEIIDHVLYVECGTTSSLFLDVKLPNRIKEENVQLCFASNGTVNILIHRKKEKIPCPQGTTRSESLKTFLK